MGQSVSLGRRRTTSTGGRREVEDHDQGQGPSGASSSNEREKKRFFMSRRNSSTSSSRSSTLADGASGGLLGRDHIRSLRPKFKRRMKSRPNLSRQDTLSPPGSSRTPSVLPYGQAASAERQDEERSELEVSEGVDIPAQSGASISEAVETPPPLQRTAEQLEAAHRDWSSRAAAEYSSLIGRRMLVQGMVVADATAPSSPFQNAERNQERVPPSSNPDVLGPVPWFVEDEPQETFSPLAEVPEPIHEEPSVADTSDGQSVYHSELHPSDRGSIYQSSLLSRLLAVTAFATARNLLDQQNGVDHSNPASALQPFGAMLRNAFMQHASELNAAATTEREPRSETDRSSWAVSQGFGRFIDRIRRQRRPATPELTLEPVPGGEENGFNVFVQRLASGQLVRLVRGDASEETGLPNDANFVRLFRFPDRGLDALMAARNDLHRAEEWGSGRPAWLPAEVPTSVIPIVMVGIRQLSPGEDLSSMGDAVDVPSSTELNSTNVSANASVAAEHEESPASTDGTNSHSSNHRWMIIVLSGHYPPNHPILTEPSIFSDQPSYEDLLALSALIGSVVKQSVTQAEIDADTSTVVVRVDDVPPSQLGDIKGGTSRQCRICLMDYESSEMIRLLKCQHCFHQECCDLWLTKSKNSCPLCRAKVIETDSPRTEPVSL